MKTQILREEEREAREGRERERELGEQGGRVGERRDPESSVRWWYGIIRN